MPSSLLSKWNLESFDDPTEVRDYVETFQLKNSFSAFPELSEPLNELPNRAHAVDPSNLEPFPPVWSDLARLHWICQFREVASVVELGSGYSTSVLAHAMELNETSIGPWVKENRRVTPPFQVMTFDESADWSRIAVRRTNESLRGHVEAISSAVELVRIESRFSTLYKSPEMTPADLFYIDGPSQFAASSPEWFMSRSHLMPMSGDAILIEHFFEPGALIVLDGRTANARFLRTSLRRNWAYRHLTTAQVHIFELQEAPLGPINQRRLDRINGAGWLLQ